MATRKKLVSRTKKKAAGTRPLGLTPLSSTQESECCAKAALILKYAHDSSDALLKAYDLTRRQRSRAGGMTTDEEQDLLRAMLVMAAAGLDATAKQLIRDALPVLIRRDERARNTFEKFIARRLEEEPRGAEKLVGSKFLARVLSRANPQGQMIEEYIAHLTRGSLQSTEALFQVAAALGVSASDVGITSDVLSPIFKTRNQIVHDLDIDLDAPRRNRNVRRQQAMIRDANLLIQVATKLLEAVDVAAGEGEP